MATYKGIQGYSVQKLSSDPGTLGDVVGQLWYNSGSGKFKVAVQAAGAWAAGSDLNTARYRWMGGFGTTTAGVVVGGLKTPGYTASALVESYNGSAWTEVADIPARADNWATGTSTAGISGTGSNLNTVYEFDGTSWAAGGNYPESCSRTNASGTQTATLAQGGAPPPGSYSNITAEYDGTSWSLGGVYPSVHANGAQCGTQAAGFAIGGYNPGTTVDCNQYNGSTWSETADTNTGHGECGGSQSGTTTAAMVVAGAPGTPAQTEIWNGTAWTEVADLANGRSSGASVGTSTVAMYMGGSPVSPGVLTEEWAGSPVTAKVVTVS